MVVEIARVLDAYRAAAAYMNHQDAVAHVAGVTGQSAETVQQVIDEEALTA